jgi:hypothetical protein
MFSANLPEMLPFSAACLAPEGMLQSFWTGCKTAKQGVRQVLAETGFVLREL